jgi:restriction system protein
MSIWEHRVDSSVITHPGKKLTCPYCETALSHDLAKDLSAPDESIWYNDAYLCQSCGWWYLTRRQEGNIISGLYDGESYSQYYGHRVFEGSGSLKSLDLTDMRQPLDEVRTYLRVRYQERFDLHPRRFEEIVASVFHDLGYRSRVTAYHSDGGIDVVLDGPSGETVGIQVKRYRGRIRVAQVRELVGALVVGGFTEGIFVTTSSFQAGCGKAAERATSKGIAVRLMDASQFLAALEITQRNVYSEGEVLQLFMSANLKLRSHGAGSCNNTWPLPLSGESKYLSELLRQDRRTNPLHRTADAAGEG